MKRYKQWLIAYAKDYRLGFLFFVVEIFVLLGVLVLSDIPQDMMNYLLVLHLFLFFVAFVVSALRYKRRFQYWKTMQENKNGIQWFAEYSKIESSCLIALCEEVIAGQNELLYKQNMEAREKLAQHQEYYAMWVHQIKTPIFALELLQRGVENPVLQSQMNAELLKIKDYTQLALHYIRMEDMATDVEFKMHSLRKIVMNLIKKYSILFINQKISLHLAEFDAKVLTDEKWLTFAISQIITNSLKYTKSGGEIRIFWEGNQLWIEDTGIGIREEDIPKLFQKGFTGNNGRLQKEASGMGLYLTAKVMNVLGHKITLESTAGKGTCVKMMFSEKRYEEY